MARWIVWLVVLVGLLLVGCQRGEVGLSVAGGGPVVRIDAPPSGARIPTGREVEIQSTAIDEGGLVERIEMRINGDLIASDPAPTAGGQESFTVVQRWVPIAPGPVSVEVVAYNATGQASRPAAITLQAEGEPLAPPQPTPAPSATPDDDVTPSPAEGSATTPTPAGDEQEEIQGIVGQVNATAGLNVRTGPSTDNERVGGVLLNEQVIGIARNGTGDWVKVRYGPDNEQEGWVAAQFVTWQGELSTLPEASD